MQDLLRIDDIEKTFTMHHLPEQTIIGCKQISFSVRPGEFIGITGRSGAGKSTILKSIYRTYIPSGGRILYQSECFGTIDLVQASDREVLAIRKEEIGYVSQFLSVMPRVSALDVVTDAVKESGVIDEAARKKAEDMLTHFKLPQKLWHSFPRTFSGGEKLRLNLARAMVKRPRLLLLDEPTASLDHVSKQSVKELLIALKLEGTSMIGIFHDLEFMEAVVDSHYHLADGQLKKVNE